ncbi:FHA domain-containing protein [Mesorhizobium sp. 1B3]|uniref:FHA domain-containing protein n=1 Tax=Mesorhizobium sp. 1B3 TaxID=3243599 RepID=UPI003D99976E
MELRLTLKGPERLLGGRREARLRDSALVIGRSPEADWPIPDPERVLSKLHCRIEKDFDGYQLTDMSTNGVKVNEEPVGYGLVRRIENGDVVKLGDAVLLAEIVTASAPPAEARTLAPAAPEIGPDDGPFGGLDGESPAPPKPASVPGERPAKGMVLDDWWGPVDSLAIGNTRKSVDISAQVHEAPIADIHAGKDTLWSHDTGGVSLLRIAAGVDVETLARAVEAAIAVLSVSERGKFTDRLSELLSKASGR